MEITKTIDHVLSVEEVWAILQKTNLTLDRVGQKHEEIALRQAETDKQLKENALRQAETDRLIKETDKQMKENALRQAETDRLIKENALRQAETDKQMKETNKRMGSLTNRFGEVVEYMIIPNLLAKFEELGFTFTKANRTKIANKTHNIFTEVDAFLENGDKVMAVEIKTKPSNDDINDHIERMEKLRVYANLHNDKRVYLGAMAGVVFNQSEKIYALKNGFYVIEPSGETFTITAPEGIYHPREW
ncbi:MAG: DUF4175 domain-containing protein [Treponema sp.]|jgi:hypothetical protein|nr:DUF4175 domain-containing protein [Treponema sp.]